MREVTLAQYLERNGYSEAFRKHYLLPMCAAVWSVPNSQVRRAAGPAPGGRGAAGGRLAGRQPFWRCLAAAFLRPAALSAAPAPWIVQSPG